MGPIWSDECKKKNIHPIEVIVGAFTKTKHTLYTQQILDLCDYHCQRYLVFW